VGPIVVLLYAAAAASSAAAPVVIDVDPGVISAARALGPTAMFFTSRSHPLASLSQLSNPAAEVGSGDVAGAKEIQALLRAGGVKVGGGAVDLMHLYTDHHFASLFTARPALRLFVVRARDDGRERLIVERGGGVRVQLRGRGQQVGATESKALAPSSGFVTSFGPLTGVTVGPTARDRRFDAQDGAHVETRTARAGHCFVVLHIDRDFHTGAGLVSFLFGSGIIFNPAFEQLAVADARGAHPPAATFAEGRTVELGYELPADPHGLVLKDGDDQLPLAPFLAAKPAARN
jgi:hypothetical protein